MKRWFLPAVLAVLLLDATAVVQAREKTPAQAGEKVPATAGESVLTQAAREQTQTYERARVREKAPDGTGCTIEKHTHVFAVKQNDTLRLDRYAKPASGDVPRPCMVFVFGGGFVSGRRDDPNFRSFFDYYVQKGFVVVSIDYRLGMKQAIASGTRDRDSLAAAMATSIAMAAEDLCDATACICAHAAKWGIDTSRVVTCGSSAGAITVLTGEYGRCNGRPEARRIPEGFRYAGIIAFAGAICEKGDLHWEQSPAPMLLFHGDADRNVPYDKVTYEGLALCGSRHIAQSLTEHNNPHWFYSVADTNHSMAWRPMQENRDEIDTFLEKLVFERQPLILETRVRPLDAEPQPSEFTLSDYLETNYRH